MTSESSQHVRITLLADIKIDPEAARAVENAYRRGVAQALSRAGDLMRAGGTARRISGRREYTGTARAV